MRLEVYCVATHNTLTDSITSQHLAYRSNVTSGWHFSVGMEIRTASFNNNAGMPAKKIKQIIKL